MSATVFTQTGVIPKSDQVGSMIVTNSTVVLGGVQNTVNYPTADTMLNEDINVDSMGAFYPLGAPLAVGVVNTDPIVLVNTSYQHLLNISIGITGEIFLPDAGLIDGQLIEVVYDVRNTSGGANINFIPHGFPGGVSTFVTLLAEKELWVFQWRTGTLPGWIPFEHYPPLNL